MTENYFDRNVLFSVGSQWFQFLIVLLKIVHRDLMVAITRLSVVSKESLKRLHNVWLLNVFLFNV